MSRHKKTRALRRQLTQEQLTKKTLKAKKKAQHFPKRKYAVKA
jgi:large subunit ribosomal protein L35e